MYFPLTVDEAMLIEPTETESVETLDAFADALIEIAREADDRSRDRQDRAAHGAGPAPRRGRRGAQPEPALAARRRRLDALPGLIAAGSPSRRHGANPLTARSPALSSRRMVGRSLRQIVWARLRRDKVAMVCLFI